MAGGTVDFGPPPKPQGVDFGPPPTHAQAVDFGPPPSKPRPITDIPVLGPRYVGPGATFRPDALAPYKPPVPQSSVRAASSLDAANQIPAAPTSADKLLGGDSGYPLVDLASNELFNRDKSRLSQAANLLPPVFLARQGAQAGQELGRGQYGQGLARLGVNAAMGLAGDAIAARARPMGFGTFTGAGAERLPAPAFEQNPTLPEALSPAVNETPRPSAAAAQVRSALIAPKPVAAPRPAEPTESFMNWSGAAEDQALSPEARAYAAQRAGAARPAADAAYAARAAMPFPGEAGGPPINPEAPVEPQAEGFTFAHEPLVSPERAPEQASEVAKAPNVVTTHHDPFDLSGESDDFLERMLDSKNPENQARAAAEIKRRYATVPTAHPVAADATAVAPPSTVTGEEANPQELQEMFSGPGIPAKARKSLGQFYRGGFIDARPLLDQPEDQPLKGEMNRVGAAATYGDALATYGGNSVRAAVSDPAKIPQIEARINAANMTARADARQKAADLATDAATKAQLTQEASNLRGHAAY